MDAAVGQRRVARANRPGPAAEVVETVTEPIGPPGPGQALVRVAAAAVNHSEGLALRGGRYAEGLEFPFPLGYEGAGTVVALGPDTDGPRVGDRVCWAPVPGSCADHLLVPADLLVAVPDELDLADAARLPSAGLTAQLLTDVWPARMPTALVWGAAGPVGRLLVSFLVESGTAVVGVASGARCDAVRRLGAALVVDRSRDDVADAVRAATGGAGVAAVFDPVGAATYRTSLDALAPGGCLIGYGELSGALPAVDPMDLMDKGLFVTKFGGGGAGLRDLATLRGLVGVALATAVRRPEVVARGESFPLSAAADAYRALAAGPDGKLLVTP